MPLIWLAVLPIDRMTAGRASVGVTLGGLLTLTDRPARQVLFHPLNLLGPQILDQVIKLDITEGLRVEVHGVFLLLGLCDPNDLHPWDLRSKRDRNPL